MLEATFRFDQDRDSWFQRERDEPTLCPVFPINPIAFRCHQDARILPRIRSIILNEKIEFKERLVEDLFSILSYDLRPLVAMQMISIFLRSCGFLKLSSMSLQKIRTLLRIMPSAASIPDDEGFLLIHRIMQWHNPNVLIADELLRACPETCSTQNPYGLTPLHALCITIGATDVNDFAFLECSLALLTSMTRLCPSAVLCTTTQGKLAIHMLMISSKGREPNIRAFKILLNACPQSVLVEIEDETFKVLLDGSGTSRRVEKWSPMKRLEEGSYHNVLNLIFNVWAQNARKRNLQQLYHK